MTLNASASLRAKLDGQQLVLDIAGDWRERAMDGTGGTGSMPGARKASAR